MAGKRAERQIWRLWAVVFLMGLATAGLVARLAYLQVLQHPEYAAEAQGEHIGTRPLVAHRGAILDRSGYPLATSIDTWDVSLDRKIWSDQPYAERAAQKLAPLVNKSPGELVSLMARTENGAEVIARQVEYDTGRKISALGLPGVIMEQSARRMYPEGDLAAPLLGFTGRDATGLTGLEADIDKPLTGRPGTLWFERDSLGNAIPFGVRHQTDPESGHDVVLTVDRTIQMMVERELDAAIIKTKARGGAIIVQDTKTGGILAMTSRPGFSRDTLNLADPSQIELVRNRTVTDMYEPGSVFKLVTMAAALNEGKVNPNTVYPDTGTTIVGDRIFHNWDFSNNGPTSMTQVLVRSLNLGTIWLADKILGAETFYKYVKLFGFGQSSGIGLEGEAPGMYRLPADDGWSRADLASNSFGQGISTTPLQIINMATAIANGGTLMRPFIIKETRGADGVKVTEPQAIRRPISEATANTVRTMMRQVLEANALAIVPGYSAGGKSGTAYVPTVATGAGSKGDAYGEEVTIPSYLGFAPFNNPRITILIKLDYLQSSDFGGTLTAPVFSKLAHDILSYLRVPPDKPETLVQQQPTPAPAGR